MTDLKQRALGMRWVPARLIAAGISLVLLLIVFSLVVVGSGQVGVVARVGDDLPVRLLAEPGFYVRVPFIDRVWLIDTRVQTTGQTALQTVNTADGQSLGVSGWAAWRVTDPIRFSQATNAGKSPVDARVNTALTHALNELAQSLPESSIVTGLEAEQQSDLLRLLNDALQMVGVTAVEAGIAQVAQPDADAQLIYKKMAAEQQQASERLVQGLQSDAQQLLALQNKQRDQVLADAYRTVQQQRQQADAQALAAYQSIYGQGPAFHNALTQPVPVESGQIAPASPIVAQ